MGKIKQMYESKAELVLMGVYVPVDTEDEVKFITSYILAVLGKDDIDPYEAIHRYTKNMVTHLGVNTIQGMVCITYCLKAEDTPDPFTEDYGSGYPAAFCYVLNLDFLDCSEFGDCFFKEEAGCYYRVS